MYRGWIPIISLVSLVRGEGLGSTSDRESSACLSISLTPILLDLFEGCVMRGKAIWLDSMRFFCLISIFNSSDGTETSSKVLLAINTCPSGMGMAFLLGGTAGRAFWLFLG